MIRLLVLLGLAVSIASYDASPRGMGTHVQKDPTSVVGAEEYEVYSALINERYTEPNAKRMFTLQGSIVQERRVLDEVTLVVIESRTVALPYEDLKRTLSGRMPWTAEETFQDFAARNQRSHPLSNKFDFKVKAEIMSEEERQSLVVDKAPHMDDFFARYPGSQGTLALSRVGFSQGKDKALVFVSAQQDVDAHSTALNTWDAYFALLTKENGRWVVQHTVYPHRSEGDSINPKSLTVDLARCGAVNHTMAWGMGSSNIAVKGRQGDECLLQVFSEVEGGYTEHECRVPVSAGELTIYEGGISFYYSHDLSNHCKVIKTGNLLLERMDPK